MAIKAHDYQKLKKVCFVNHEKKRYLSDGVKITRGE